MSVPTRSVPPDPAAARRRALIGARVKAVRKTAGLTQERTAIAAGLDRSFYVDFENGRHSISVDRLFQVADALQCDIADLLVDLD